MDESKLPTGNNRSREITSSQTTIHPHLKDLVAKHCATHFRKPYAAHTTQAFAHVEQQLLKAKAEGISVFVDACCGTGESSLLISKDYPDALVIGIDKSTHRLAKGVAKLSSLPANLLLLQADIIDFWRLCDEHAFRFTKVYLFYPNPYPKPEHLMRRWHGHPVFPTLLHLTPSIELRTNWKIYAEEFAYALGLAGRQQVQFEEYHPTLFGSPFESKYAASGHSLWRVQG